MSKEILIEGRGLAAHNLAHELGQNGWKVLLTGRPFTTTRSWFVLGDRLPQEVREKVQNGEIKAHALQGCRFVIVNPEKGIAEHDFTADTNNILDPFACMMIDYNGLKKYYLQRALNTSGVETVNSRVSRIERGKNDFVVDLEDGSRINVEKVVDASGTESRLLRRFIPEKLDDDTLVLWIYGYRTSGHFDPKVMVFPLKDNRTGRLSWIAPWSSTEADILASDYCRVKDYRLKKKSGYFEEIYENLRSMCNELGICRIEQNIEPVNGRIRVVPLNSAPPYDMYAVGDAAGQACPNMAEGIFPALRNSTMLASKLNEDPDYSGRKYYYDWRYGDPAEPYDLSASFLYKRFMTEGAAENAAVYEAIASCGDPTLMLRILTERKPRLGDIPELIKQGVINPNLFKIVISHLVRSRLIFTLPSYKNILYGNGH